MQNLPEEVPDGQQDERIVSRMLAEVEGQVSRHEWARAYVAGRRDMYLAACIFLGTHGFRPGSNQWLKAWEACGAQGANVTTGCAWPQPCRDGCRRCQDLDAEMAANWFHAED
jgi:hypothetical protein